MNNIILNCPSVNAETGECNGNGGYYKNCENNEKCLLKRIVRNLKTVINSNLCENCDGCGYDYGCEDANCGYYQARKSIELLDIEECE